MRRCEGLLSISYQLGSGTRYGPSPSITIYLVSVSENLWFFFLCFVFVVLRSAIENLEEYLFEQRNLVKANMADTELPFPAKESPPSRFNSNAKRKFVLQTRMLNVKLCWNANAKRKLFR